MHLRCSLGSRGMFFHLGPEFSKRLEAEVKIKLANIMLRHQEMEVSRLLLLIEMSNLKNMNKPYFNLWC